MRVLIKFSSAFKDKEKEVKFLAINTEAFHIENVKRIIEMYKQRYHHVHLPNSSDFGRQDLPVGAEQFCSHTISHRRFYETTCHKAQ